MNRLLIGGFLGSDPVLRGVGDKVVANFSLGVKSSKDDTFWVNCCAWNALAEQVSGLKKGAQLCLRGYLREERWMDKTTGQERSKLVAVATELLAEPHV